MLNGTLVNETVVALLQKGNDSCVEWLVNDAIDEPRVALLDLTTFAYAGYVICFWVFICTIIVSVLGSCTELQFFKYETERWVLWTSTVTAWIVSIVLFSMATVYVHAINNVYPWSKCSHEHCNAVPMSLFECAPLWHMHNPTLDVGKECTKCDHAMVVPPESGDYTIQSHTFFWTPVPTSSVSITGSLLKWPPAYRLLYLWVYGGLVLFVTVTLSIILSTAERSDRYEIIANRLKRSLKECQEDKKCQKDKRCQVQPNGKGGNGHATVEIILNQTKENPMANVLHATMPGVSTIANAVDSFAVRLPGVQYLKIPCADPDDEV